MNKISKKAYLASTLILLAFGTTNASAAGDAAAGEAKAAVCAACHGPAGISSNPLWPNLAGQKEAYLAKQIKAYRDGLREEVTMTPFVSALSDQDVKDLAAHFAGLTPCP